jgi:hypothetical protein
LRRAIGWFLAACAVLLPLHALLFFLYQGEVRFRIDLSRFDIHSKDVELNTYVNDVGSDSIARCYDAACSRLDALRGSLPRQTYYCEDEMTYPSISSIVQLSGQYLEVRAYSGNDSDGVAIRNGTGLFPARERGAKRLWAGPISRILR